MPITETFPKPLDVRYIDGRVWRLLKPFVMVSTVAARTLKVAAGFETDFHSIPRFFWRIAPPTAYGEPSIIHDYAYRLGVLDRALADAVYYEGLLAVDCPRWRARIMYRVVRLFGGSRYQPSASSEVAA